jgi:isoleucyl-tRNA synthetase
MTQVDKKSYKDTLNLPQTAFAMEAKLVQNEPARLRRWKDARLYDQVQQARANDPCWVLHDGPPFANGDIHIGHVINKVLKDVFIRFRTMQGHRTPYVPGWDCHGLPIEHKIQEQIKKEGKHLRDLSTVEVRQRCFAYADKYAKVQSEQFQRLGILGDWDNPYLTMVPGYEASTLAVFAKFVEAGLVYKQLKPVPWSVANQTALADAELEYQDVTDPSVYVEFPVDPATELAKLAGGKPAYFLVWTTTPWTLPANLAIAAGPQVRYALVEYTKGGEQRVGVVAEDLAERVLKRPGVESFRLTGTVLTGEELAERSEYVHPFIEYKGRVLTADYVTTTDGTGLVHTAPGHGEEDYDLGVRHGLQVYSPVLANGRFDETVPEFLRGKSTKEGNPLIVDELKRRGRLLAEEPVLHSYPHDWRSKTPIIFRATEQWFVAMDKPFKLPGEEVEVFSHSLRERGVMSVDPDWRNVARGQSGFDRSAPPPLGFLSNEVSANEDDPSRLTAIGQQNLIEFKAILQQQVQFVPAWGGNRLVGMLSARPDWCISRQRAWGLPIPVFYNEKGDALLTPESVRAVAKRFAEKGSDAWFTDSPAELLGDYDPGPNFPKDQLRKEQDIFDVWFESGSSWNAVLSARPGLEFPADLYLEGSDQHRGWFQLSLLPSLGATGRPPFKGVLTHGFVVKPDGKKVSKSDPEYVTATKEIDTHGADLLRLWTCSVDYEGDIPASPKVIKEFGDKYRKVRNTLRYLLSNLYDFNPATDAQDVPANSLDGWAAAELDKLIADATAAYDAYQTHRAFRLLHDFCSVQVSAFYAAAMKDRLYCEAPNAPLRRRCQTVMHRMLVALTKLLAPMVVFTADEVWEHIAHKPAGEEGLSSVHLALLPKPSGAEASEEQRREWQLLFELRDAAMLQIDPLLRKFPKQIKPLDMEVVVRVDDDAMRRKLEAYGPDLEDLLGVGFTSFADKSVDGPAVSVEVLDRRETYKACARSWKRRPDVGSDAEYPDLSARDAAAVRTLAKVP